MPRIQNKSIRVSRKIHSQLIDIAEKLNLTLAQLVEEAVLEKIWKIKLLEGMRPKTADPPPKKQNRRFGENMGDDIDEAKN